MLKTAENLKGRSVSAAIPPAQANQMVATPARASASAAAQLRHSADELEATFLAEMLKSAKVGEPRRAFGGGAGEEQFASFLRLELARDLVRAGGVGLAEGIFQALRDRQDADFR